MPFREDRFEQYAMQAETIGQQDKRWVDLNAIGESLGFQPDESRLYAETMEERGWVAFHPSDRRQFKLTDAGRREIAKLRWPRWRRWLEKHPAIIGAIAGAIAGAVVTGAIKLLERWLFQ